MCPRPTARGSERDGAATTLGCGGPPDAHPPHLGPLLEVVPGELAGVLWTGYAALGDGPAYDASLHAVFLGFVMSMVFAHAPLIVPAVPRVPLPFRRGFYIHLALLHASLALRLVGGDLAGNATLWQGGRYRRRARDPAVPRSQRGCGAKRPTQAAIAADIKSRAGPAVHQARPTMTNR